MDKFFIAFILAGTAILMSGEGQAASSQQPGNAASQIENKAGQSSDVNINQTQEDCKKANAQAGVTDKKTKKTSSKKKSTNKSVGCTSGRYHPGCNTKSTLNKSPQNSQ